MKQYSYKIGNTNYDVTITAITGSHASVEVNGLPFEVDMMGSTLVESELPEGGSAAEAPAPAPAAVPSATPQPAPANEEEKGAGEGTAVKAPLPGVVRAVKVTKGQAVKRGDTVLVLEAMKMENNIAAEADGVVTGIAVSEGESVLEGTVLVTIA